MCYSGLLLMPLPCAALGPQVDVAGFGDEMESQRKRSQASREEVDLTAGALLGEIAAQTGATSFTGYEQLQGSGRVVALLVGGRQVQEVSEGEWCLELLAPDSVMLRSTPWCC